MDESNIDDLDRSKHHPPGPPAPGHPRVPDEDTAAGTGTGASDFLSLRITDAPAGGKAGWLADRMRSAVAEHRLRPGDRLPPGRTLAADLGVSRGVVTEAYRRLLDDGVVVTAGRRGTVVAATPPHPPAPRLHRPPTPGPRRVPTRVPDGLFTDPDPGVFAALRTTPARIDLTPGLPDLGAFPRSAWLQAERAILDDLTPADLGYGDPAGTLRLRETVAGWLARFRGITADPDEIVIVAGVAQALALLARVLARRGDARIAVEDPGSLGARRQLQHWGMSTVGVPVDDAGLRVDELRATGCRTVMVSPAHEFPMGVVLGGARRRELLDWAADGGLVIEDDYDAEHRYDRPPVTALKAGRPDRVCYTGSVSKILAPALRIGWLLPPDWLCDEVVSAKQEADLGNPALAQLVLERLMRLGRLESHLRLVRRRHRRRRDVMVAALARHLPAATVHGAAAGLHLTVTFEEPADDRALAAAALAAGVKVQPLSWHRIAPGRPGLVLGYAASSAGQIVDGLAVIGELAGARQAPPPT